MSIDTIGVDLLLPSMRTYLVGLDIVRLPGTPNNPLPPLWLDLWKGVPYPGQTQDLGPTESNDNLVLGAYPATGIPSKPVEGFYDSFSRRFTTYAISTWVDCRSISQCAAAICHASEPTKTATCTPAHL
jgi:hypothetical protein